MFYRFTINACAGIDVCVARGAKGGEGARGAKDVEDTQDNAGCGIYCACGGTTKLYIWFVIYGFWKIIYLWQSNEL